MNIYYHKDGTSVCNENIGALSDEQVYEIEKVEESYSKKELEFIHGLLIEINTPIKKCSEADDCSGVLFQANTTDLVLNNLPYSIVKDNHIYNVSSFNSDLQEVTYAFAGMDKKTVNLVDREEISRQVDIDDEYEESYDDDDELTDDEMEDISADHPSSNDVQIEELLENMRSRGVAAQTTPNDSNPYGSIRTQDGVLAGVNKALGKVENLEITLFENLDEFRIIDRDSGRRITNLGSLVLDKLHAMRKYNARTSAGSRELLDMKILSLDVTSNTVNQKRVIFDVLATVAAIRRNFNRGKNLCTNHWDAFIYALLFLQTSPSFGIFKDIKGYISYADVETRLGNNAPIAAYGMEELNRIEHSTEDTMSILKRISYTAIECQDGKQSVLIEGEEYVVSPNDVFTYKVNNDIFSKKRFIKK